jgi:glucose-1-phosphate cytidylyltransferase
VFSLTEHDPVVHSFTEKPQGDGSWINGGFFVLNPDAIDYVEGDDTVWEQAPMRQLANDGELVAYRHAGFWQPMDSLRDKSVLEGLWAGGSAPWRVWDAGGRQQGPRPSVVPITVTE